MTRSARGHGAASSRAATTADSLSLTTVEDLRDYCYVVAGIVGEMLTELFLLGRPQLAAACASTCASARHLFGEGLQLVNILKDPRSDAREGRLYLPARRSRDEIFALARADLARASEYVLELQKSGAPRGRRRVHGPSGRAAPGKRSIGSRCMARDRRSRGPKVFQIVHRLNRDLDRNRPAVRTRAANSPTTPGR